jgi:hypothetical protein
MHIVSPKIGQEKQARLQWEEKTKTAGRTM